MKMLMSLGVKCLLLSSLLFLFGSAVGQIPPGAADVVESVNSEGEAGTDASLERETAIADTSGSENAGKGEREEAPSFWFGWFRWLCAAIRLVLEQLYLWSGSWALSLVLLAVLIRLLLMPFSAANTRQQMRVKTTLAAIKPEVDAIKEKYKNKPHKRDEAIMALRKEHGVSATEQLKGCLPLMIQLPILIALFRVILSLDAMKGAGLLWIDDLTAPDALFSWGVAIPWLGSTFNLLPFMLFGALLILAKLAATEESGKSMYIMPVAVTLCFYPFPAGALLYWTVGNYIQVAETLVFRPRPSDE